MVSGLKVLLGLQTHAHKLITFKVKIGELSIRSNEIICANISNAWAVCNTVIIQKLGVAAAPWFIHESAPKGKAQPCKSQRYLEMQNNHHWNFSSWKGNSFSSYSLSFCMGSRFLDMYMMSIAHQSPHLLWVASKCILWPYLNQCPSIFNFRKSPSIVSFSIYAYFKSCSSICSISNRLFNNITVICLSYLVWVQILASQWISGSKTQPHIRL